MPELTVLYDGNCSLCRLSADRVRRLDPHSRIELLSLHETSVPARFPQVNPHIALRRMQAVDSRGQVFSGADAWGEILRVLGWRWAYRLLRLPGVHFAAGRVYDVIARQRYRWNRQACSDGACSVHLPENTHQTRH